ncbi:thiamine pyrophosphate-dependent enzyme [Candidatus Brachybacter algidus]|uniref:thiamine pyrophosphate-dependent enzyme n=1 Tax=Candidatus Brachybacter algidus TaxID=2982024 RepID=UPI00257AD429|nr:thiamine pyrophosphate-dependent enzyme [Candidatus Brachybacter algidus]
MALAKKMDKDPGFVFVSTGDGELQEGQIWEAAMFAPFHKLDNLMVTVDWNGQQIDGTNDQVLSLGDLESRKWRTFGWRVVVTDGNDMESIVKALEEAKTHVGTDIPTVILMRTNMGCGVDFMMGTRMARKSANKEQLDKGLSQLVSSLDDFVYNENYSAPNHKH